MRAELGDDVTAEQAREWGYRDNRRTLQDDLGRIGVHFDTWFSERTLHERGDVKRVLDDLGARGVVFEHDGATLVAHHRLRRPARPRAGAVRRHHHVPLQRPRVPPRQVRPRVEAPHRHLGRRPPRPGEVAAGRAWRRSASPDGEPEVLLGQLVKLVQGGEPVRMSKRTGNIITLADILDEVDPDVARMTFLLQGIDTPQTFDLDVVTAQSMENPVYYVQYAHARVASIGRKAAEAGVTRRPVARHVDLAPLVHERELELLRALAVYPDVRRRGGRAARAAEGHHLGARLRQRVPRLLPRLPGDHRRRRAHAGPAVAGRGVPASGSRTRSRSSACTRPTRWRASTTTTTSAEP